MNKEKLFQAITEKPFILGIGSQRAGSTLLSQLLSEASSIYMHPVKELHYFDTINGIRNYEILREFSTRRLDVLIDGATVLSEKKHPNNTYFDAIRSHYLSLSKRPSQFNYKQHFLAVASRNEEHIQYYAENTPEYQLLPIKQYEKIKSIFPKLKVILMVRNPAKRFFSSLNLLLNYSNFAGDDKDFIEHASKFVYDDKNGWTHSQNLYNDYTHCISNLQAAGIEPLVLGFDDFINDPKKSVDKLSKYLELDLSHLATSKLFTRKVNAVSRNLKYPLEMQQYVEKKYNQNRFEIEEYIGSKLEK